MLKRDVLVAMLILLATLFGAPLTLFAQQIRVPNVVNMDPDQAKKAIETVGLKISISGNTPTTDVRVNGKVASQNPGAGQNVQKGDTVKVSTYQYQQPPPIAIAVPDVINMDPQRAANTLKGVGLKYRLAGTTTPTTEQGKHGRISSQIPSAGEKVQKGVFVTVHTYQYQASLVTVPNLVNMDPQQAANMLQGVGLKYQSAGTTPTAEQSKHGKVAFQSPAAGQNVQKGGTVSVSVHQYFAIVPNVINMDPQQAANTLQGVGLKYQSAGTTPTTEQSKHGKLAFQNPAAGQNVQKGAIVSASVYQYKQPEVVAVPNVLGMDEEQATQRLKKMEFVSGAQYDTSSRNPREFHKVLRQTPTAGQSAPKGSLVRLSLAKPDFSSVPNVVGLPVEQARQNLEKAGYAVIISQDFGATLDPGQDGKVVNQGLPAGADWAVLLKLYKLTGIQVPNIVGMTTEKAKQVLEKSGLVMWQPEPVATKERRLDGTIASQDPTGRLPHTNMTVNVKVYRYYAVVPNIVGMTYAEAKQVLEKLGLSVNGTTIPVATQDRSLHGKMAGQEYVKTGDFVEPNRVIYLREYRYSLPAPNLIGMTYEQAQGVAQKAGIFISRDSQSVLTDNRALNGKIASQSTSPGQLISSTESSFSVKTYAFAVLIPNVTGTAFQEAKQTMERAGFKVERTNTTTQNAGLDGRVAGQNPAAGQKADYGSNVTLSTYTYPSVKIPKVVGMTHTQARDAIEQVGFTWNQVIKNWTIVNDQRLAAGIVDTQEPAAGEMVKLATYMAGNNMITLRGRVYQKADFVKIPNLLNVKEDEARNRLEAAGLYVSVYHKDTGRKEWDGLVLEQTPPAGTEVVTKTATTLTAYRYSGAAIEASMRYIESEKHYLLGLTGGVTPYDVSAQYDVPSNLKGTKVLEILALQDNPTQPNWKWYRVTAKIPLKIIFIVKDNKNQMYRYSADLKGQ